jgi:signal transduction histidine kinase
MRERQFIVDAALLRELGERLIGQPAIALGELVKNAFDADASTCRIEFRADEIVISDNGIGMSARDFLKYWMRIGTTHKVNEASSKVLRRTLTGSKGIGRLTTQFLADEMILESTSIKNTSCSLYSMVDWRNAVPGQNLSKVNVDWDMQPETAEYANGSEFGTRITLKSLKHEWNADKIRDLGADVWVLRSPFKRSSEPETTERTKNIKKRRPEDFFIEIDAPEIANAKQAFDETLEKVFSNWQARIRGTLEGGRSNGAASISVEFKAGYPEGSVRQKPFRSTVRLPVVRTPAEPMGSLLDKVSFEILIFKATGKQPTGIAVADLRKYLQHFGNVSVYDGGFRLPYYGSRDTAGQDWLSIAVDQARRLSVSELLPERLRTQNKFMLDLPALGRIFGAVEINTNHERAAAQKVRKPSNDWLQISSGRDRLTDNAALKQLHDLVRFSLDFYANRYRLLALDAAEKRRAQEPSSKKYDRAIKILETNKRDIPRPVFLEVRREVSDALKASKAEEKAIESRVALLAPLASAGMMALALNHEVSREIRFLERIGKAIRRIANRQSIPELKAIAGEFDEAKGRLSSLRELFAPLISDEDKAASERLRVKSVVEQTIRGMSALMPGVKFDKSGVPTDLRFPLGSLADWNAVLQNVLANAWNALLDSDRAEVAFRGGRDKSGREWLRVSDSGQGLDVPVAESDKLFEPFERRMAIRKDKRSIAIGGQGLGLTIVRMIAHRRKAEVSFITPEEGFSTTIEIAWRGART